MGRSCSDKALTNNTERVLNRIRRTSIGFIGVLTDLTIINDLFLEPFNGAGKPQQKLM
jgi:hypothetical protein